jgi:multiple sugar transport system permease protein
MINNKTLHKDCRFTEIKKVFLTMILLIIAIIALFPYIYMISGSFKREIDIFSYPFELFPPFFQNNYIKVWGGNYNFAQYYLNSIKVTSVSLLGILVTSSMAAYGFTKINFKGRDTLFLLYLATLMIPQQVTLVPRFILFKQLNITDTHYALILPGIFTAFGVFLIRQSMVSIPNELSESAKVDGAGHLRIWLQIVTPLTKPALVTLALISSIWSWNDYENPLIFITSMDLYTIPLGLISFTDETGMQYSLILAASVSATLPLIILFLFGQRFFIEGIAAGAVKG